MKLYYSIYGIMVIGLVACAGGSKKEEGTEKKDTTTIEKPSAEKPSAEKSAAEKPAAAAPATVEIRLTEAQVKAIDLRTGELEQRNLRTSLKVNGKLTLPPQNQAQVSSLTGGIVKSIRVKDGDFVPAGQVLATLQNNEVIQWQQDYLENRSQLRYLEAEYTRQKSLRADSINSEKTF